MEKNKKIAFGSIAASFVFLFNPSFVIVDPLPDFIGYLFLIHGLMFFADLNETVADAVALFKKMLLVDLAKLGSVLWVFGIASAQEQASYMLLAMFVFLVLDFLILLPAYRKLFYGLNQLGDFHPNTSIHGTAGKGKKKSHTDRILRSTTLFVILKNALAFLPELTELSSGTYADYRSEKVLNLYSYIGLLRFFAFLPVLIVGIAWLVRIQRYFRRVAKDTPFLESLRLEYAQRVLPKVGLFTIRSLKNAFFVLLGAAVFLVDFYLDSVNVIPDVLAAICFLVFFFFVQNTVSIKRGPMFASAGLFLILSIAAEIGDYVFHTYYYFSAHLMGEEMIAFCIKAGIQLLSCLAFVLVMLQMTRVLFDVIRNHTGVSVGVQKITQAERNMEIEYQKELRQTVVAVWICLGIQVMTTVALIFRPLLSSLFERNLGFLNPLQWVGTLALFLAVFRAKDAIYESVQAKYLLE